MLKELDDYDWAEVFGEGGGGNCTTILPTINIDGKEIDESSFSREDVASIKGQVPGENEGPSWIIWGVLKDGRYFIARGSCDYTGWDCQASNSGNVATSEENLIKFGMDRDERTRFGLEFEDEKPTR